METQAKRQYNKILSELLKKGEEAELAEKLELLRLFLESTDFSKLRGEYEKHLQEGKGVKVTLYLEEGKPEYEMQVF